MNMLSYMQTFRKSARVLTLILLLSAGGVLAQSTGNADAILGVFRNNDSGRKIEVYKENNQYFGKITELGKETGKAQVGTIVLKNLTYADGKWRGKVYAPNRGSDYSVVITLPDHGTMAVRVSVGFISRTGTWKRVQQ
jgi:uncharacterized protein (DUF2147 family)